MANTDSDFYEYMDNSDLPYDGSYMVEVEFPFIMTDLGEIAVAHFLECSQCKISYTAYVNMKNVKNDFLERAQCINCLGTGLKVITYNVFNSIDN